MCCAVLANILHCLLSNRITWLQELRNFANGLWGIETLEGFRKRTLAILGLESSGSSFQSLLLNQLSDMLYRDTINQKHCKRDRLEKELTDKKRSEQTPKALPPPHSPSAIAEIILEHLLVVTGLDIRLVMVWGCQIIG